MSVLGLLSYAGTAIGLSVGLFCLASGLYFLAQYIEENPLKTKRFIRNSLFTSVAAHIVLLLDGLPKIKVMFSAMCQVLYLPILNSQFPMINVSSPMAVLAAVATLANHFLWFSHFMHSTRPLSELVTFYTFMIWGIPLCLLVSMTNSTQGLPNFAQVHTKGKNRNIIVALLSALFAIDNPVDPQHSN